MVDSGGLLSRCTGNTVPWVRIPPSPPLPSATQAITSQRAPQPMRRFEPNRPTLPRELAKSGIRYAPESKHQPLHQ